MGGRGKGAPSAVKQFPVLEKDRSRAGWRALEGACSPEDPPHLEVTHESESVVRLVLQAGKLQDYKPFLNFTLEKCVMLVTNKIGTAARMHL